MPACFGNSRHAPGRKPQVWTDLLIESGIVPDSLEVTRLHDMKRNRAATLRTHTVIAPFGLP